MTSPAAAPPRESGRLERRKARTRASILSAASELFLKNGYEDTSIQQIAELADTGVGTLYGYFASKDEVLKEVLREHSANAVQNYRASIDRSTPPIDKVIRGLSEYRRYIADNRKLITAAFYVGTRDGRVIWIDEALTPDSSRFWSREGYAPGRSQPSWDKQYVRDYLETVRWDKRPPGPTLPDEVVDRTRAKYVEAYERITGEKLDLASAGAVGTAAGEPR